ncbi:MAG: hypothetical protein C4570_08230 [Ammonifex sp.]|nr:MAG: hypothetical protein C4570_08230 [Ammonifex sp.]
MVIVLFYLNPVTLTSLKGEVFYQLIMPVVLKTLARRITIHKEGKVWFGSEGTFNRPFYRPLRRFGRSPTSSTGKVREVFSVDVIPKPVTGRGRGLHFVDYSIGECYIEKGNLSPFCGLFQLILQKLKMPRAFSREEGARLKQVSRKEFLKSLGGWTLRGGDRRKAAYGPQRSNTGTRPARGNEGKEVATVCTRCSRGCGLLLTVQCGKVVGVQGDPDHPAGQGYLCDDAASLLPLGNPGNWAPEPLYRPGGAPAWEVADWGRISRLIAGRIKQTRDASFDKSYRRTPGIGFITDNSLFNNEESYLFFKFFQSLGVVAAASGGERSGALSFGNWHLALDRFAARWYGHAAAGLTGSASYLPEPGDQDLFSLLQARTIKGMFIWGGGFFPDTPAGKAVGFVEDLDWLVLGNWFKTEKDFKAEREKVAAVCPRAEIFCLPLAGPWEKTGSLVSAERWVQWCVKVVDPRGQARAPLWVVDRLFRDVRTAYQDGGVFPGPIVHLQWDYNGESVPDVKRVAAEISEFFAHDRPFCGQGRLNPDDLTACGLPLFAGYWAEKEVPSTRRGLSGQEWGFPLTR